MSYVMVILRWLQILRKWKLIQFFILFGDLAFKGNTLLRKSGHMQGRRKKMIQRRPVTGLNWVFLLRWQNLKAQAMHTVTFKGKLMREQGPVGTPQQ